MKTKTRIILAVATLGALLALFFAWRGYFIARPYDDALEAAMSEAESAKEASEAMKEELIALREEVKKKDGEIRAKKEAEIRALPAGGLADRHLAALARFRGSPDDQAGAEGLGSPGD